MFRIIRQIWVNLKPKDKRYLSLAFWILGVLGFFSIAVLPRLFTLNAPLKWMQFSSSSSNVANTINGIAVPFIGLASAILTFFAFWVQYQANEQQKDQFEAQLAKQKIDDEARESIWRVERFENRFYELLKLHKENVNEMNIGDRVLGRKCFVPMFYEFRYIYKWSEKMLNQNPDITLENNSTTNLLSFCYKIFFFGIGPNSEKHFVHYLSPLESQLFPILKKHLSGLQDDYQNKIKEDKGLKYVTINAPLAREADDLTVEFYYYPFDGHINRLGHYYRHLFQTGKYVISQPKLNEDEKYSYIKMLRAQLSNFEQLLLYYNSMAWFKEEWRSLFVDYRLIKNIPLPLADFDINPEDFFAEDIERLELEKNVQMFEWNEG